MSNSPSREEGGSEAKASESRRQGRVVSIDVLPDEILLEIFDFWHLMVLEDKNDPLFSDVLTQGDWWILSIVCRRWRQILLGSPSRLRLCLHCNSYTPDHILHFPYSLPLLMADIEAGHPWDLGYAPRLFEHMNRALKIALKGSRYILAKLCAELVRSAPLLEHLVVETSTPGYVDTRLPSAFFNGSAPRLRRLRLDGIAIVDSPSFRAATARLVSLSVKLFRDLPVEHFLSVLSHLPMLQELEVGNVEFAQEEMDWNIDSPPAPLAIRATLPRLSRLYLRTAYPWIALIVMSMEASSVTDLSIHPFILNAASCQLPSLSQLLAPTGEASTVTAHFELGLVDCTVTLGAKASQVTMRFGDSSKGYGQELGALACALGALAGEVATVGTLKFEGDLNVHRFPTSLPGFGEGFEDTPTHWHEALSPLSAVQELLFPAEPSFVTVARLLSAESPAGTGLFPSLCYIGISDRPADLRASRRGKPSAGDIKDFVGAFTPFLEARESANRPVQLRVDLEEQEVAV
ncbi:hypothetical protein BC834DRAFT_972759 [Gloeopeniophorella convolvens]|nr:hypothetical protein BC834DRAFT_972759 [Gloeopeniophorella convolvens]